MVQTLECAPSKLCLGGAVHQARYYDFNGWSERKFTEKLRYIHLNPVPRGLVDQPEDWPWSSFRHYLPGEACGVEIEWQWTARARSDSQFFQLYRPQRESPPKRSLNGAPSRVGATLKAGHPPTQACVDGPPAMLIFKRGPAVEVCARGRSGRAQDDWTLQACCRCW